MEAFILFVIFVILPAVIYLVMAEEVDDSLSHKIPSAVSRNSKLPEGQAGSPGSEIRDRKTAVKDAEREEEPRNTFFRFLLLGVSGVSLATFFLFVAFSVLAVLFGSVMVLLGVATGEVNPFLGILFVAGVALRLWGKSSSFGSDSRPPREEPPIREKLPRGRVRAAPEPAPSMEEIIIEQRTFLGSLLRGILVVCCSVMVAVMLLRMKGVEWIPSWIITDAVLGFIAAAVLMRYARSGYTIDPAARTIVHEEVTPLIVRRRNIAFGEISAVSVRGVQKGWPLLYRYHYMQFQVVLIFDNGLVLPVYDPVNATDFLFGALESVRARAMELADVLGCPVYPWRHLGEVSFKQWKSEITRLSGKSEQPEDLEKSLLETYFSSLGMGLVGQQQLKADMTTRVEMFMLALVVAFFGITTWYALSTEWRYLAENPRILYLILLDCTSIVVTLFGLWHLLVDEYYVFDVETGAIEYRSRWAFWKTSRVIGQFGDVRDIRISRVLSISSLKREYAAELRFSSGDHLLVSDKSPTSGIPVFRAFVLTRLIGRYIIADPDAFEKDVRLGQPGSDQPERKRLPRGLTDWSPTALGGLLPGPAQELFPPPGSGTKRAKPRRNKRRKK